MITSGMYDDDYFNKLVKHLEKRGKCNSDCDICSQPKRTESYLSEKFFMFDEITNNSVYKNC